MNRSSVFERIGARCPGIMQRTANALVRAAGAIALLALAFPLPVAAEDAAEGAASPAAATATATTTATTTEARPAVAPPGQCAEPRTAVDARTGEGFSVVGPVSALFDPIDVAAAPAIEGDPGLRPAPPVPRPLVRPGACDQPGSGCSAPTASGIVVEPPAGGGNLPPPGIN